MCSVEIFMNSLVISFFLSFLLFGFHVHIPALGRVKRDLRRSLWHKEPAADFWGGHACLHGDEEVDVYCPHDYVGHSPCDCLGPDVCLLQLHCRVANQPSPAPFLHHHQHLGTCLGSWHPCSLWPLLPVRSSVPVSYSSHGGNNYEQQEATGSHFGSVVVCHQGNQAIMSASVANRSGVLFSHRLELLW